MSVEMSRKLKLTNLNPKKLTFGKKTEDKGDYDWSKVNLPYENSRFIILVEGEAQTSGIKSFGKTKKNYRIYIQLSDEKDIEMFQKIEETIKKHLKLKDLVLLRENEYGVFIVADLRPFRCQVKIGDTMYKDPQDWQEHGSGPSSIQKLKIELPYVSYSRENDPTVKVNFCFANLEEFELEGDDESDFEGDSEIEESDVSTTRDDLLGTELKPKKKKPKKREE